MKLIIFSIWPKTLSILIFLSLFLVKASEAVSGHTERIIPIVHILKLLVLGHHMRLVLSSIESRSVLLWRLFIVVHKFFLAWLACFILSFLREHFVLVGREESLYRVALILASFEVVVLPLHTVSTLATTLWRFLLVLLPIILTGNSNIVIRLVLVVGCH